MTPKGEIGQRRRIGDLEWRRAAAGIAKDKGSTGLGGLGKSQDQIIETKQHPAGNRQFQQQQRDSGLEQQRAGDQAERKNAAVFGKSPGDEKDHRDAEYGLEMDKNGIGHRPPLLTILNRFARDSGDWRD
jgi:hypothetical protein